MSLVGMDPRETERAELDAAMAKYLANPKNKIEQLAPGAMAHNAMTMKRTALPTSSQVEASKPPTPPESVPVTGVHRIPNATRHVQPPAKPSRVREPVVSKRERWPEFAPMLALALQHLVDGDTHHTLAAKLDKKPMAAWQLLIRLEGKGAVRRASWQGRTTWKRVP
jgi:hypothetical protein